MALWGNSPTARDVFVSQKRIVRAIFGLPVGTSCRSVFSNHKILTQCSLYIYGVCIFVFKNRRLYRTGEDIHSINTRSRADLRPVARRLTLGQSSVDYIGLNIFNKLPMAIKESVTINAFKKSLRRYLAGRCIYTLDEYMS